MTQESPQIGATTSRTVSLFFPGENSDPIPVRISVQNEYDLSPSEERKDAALATIVAWAQTIPGASGDPYAHGVPIKGVQAGSWTQSITHDEPTPEPEGD